MMRMQSRSSSPEDHVVDVVELCMTLHGDSQKVVRQGETLSGARGQTDTIFLLI